MPPHCDSMDGPVVGAARKALDAADPRVVLPYVPRDGEREVIAAFERAQEVRRLGPEAHDLADRYFFETVVRVHRAGEGAPYTGLKPAGLDVGPVIPVAERALESGSGKELVALLCGIVEHEVETRLTHAIALRNRSNGDVEANREYVEAMLGLQVWSHALYQAAKARPHEGGHGHSHGP